MNQTTFKKTDRYISDLFAKEDKHLKAIERSLAGSKMQHWGISANQGKFLQLMATACKAKKILELGTLGGYSAIWMARALPKDGKLVTVELDKGIAAIARKNIKKAGLENKVEVRVGKAMEHLKQMIQKKEGPFDLVFFDADKPPYAEYFQLALKLSRKGTLIIADNVIREGKVMDKSPTDEAVIGVQRFNKMLAACPDVTATILTTIGAKNYDGMAIAVVK